MNRTVPTLLVAGLVLLAGCAGGITGQSGTQSTVEDSGTVSFYVSDEANAIDQFESLNVTITKVGFSQTSDADANASASEDVETDSENETVTDSETETETETDTETETETDTETDTETETETDSETDTETETETETESDDDSQDDSETDEESESESEDEAESEDDGEGNAEWVERDVDSRTVDLTELQGANATLLQNMSVPAGEYEKVFVHVEDVNGTLKTGEEVNVKLPSEKLHLNKDFTVDSESNVEFVFDITVFEAGNSGKYILKPVAGESGTDVPIERVDGDDVEADLDVNAVGEVRAGENVTVQVTQDGDPVSNATVEVEDADVTVTTNANGTATVQVPADAEEFEVEAATGENSEYGEGEGELEVEFGEDDEREGDDGDDGERDVDDQTNESADLAVTLQGSFAASENVTVVATDGDGDPVEDATVEVDGDVVGETNADGELTFTVPGNVSTDSQVSVTADGTTVVVDSMTVATAS